MRALGNPYVVVIVVLLVPVSQSRLEAADIHVPGDWPTIQTGLYAATPGDRVVVAPGLYDENVLLVPSVELTSQDGVDPSMTVIRAASGRVIEGGAVSAVLRGLTIDGCGSASEGIWVNSTDIVIENCIVTGCQRGLKEFNWPTIHVVNSRFHHNYDGLYLGSTHGTIVEDSVFIDNTHNGLYFTDWSTATVRNSRILNNGHDGVEVYWGANPRIGPGNSIYGNAHFDVENRADSAPINAEDNWWGQAPPDPAQFGGNVDYVPYLPVPGPGDANHDGCVDGLDYVIWSSNYKTGTTWEQGDFTGEGYVDGLDYIVWSSNYLAGCPAAVPEPATLGMLAIGALAVLRHRRS